MKKFSLVLLTFGILASGCGDVKTGVKQTASFFDGRVVVEFVASGNNRETTDRIIYSFYDTGEYQVTFVDLEGYKDSQYFEFPDDLKISVDAGQRRISKDYNSFFGMSPRFKMLLTRNEQQEAFEYSSIPSSSKGPYKVNK